MGFDVRAVVMVGIHLESHDEGMEFVKQHFSAQGEFDSDEIDTITNGLTWEMISAYSDRGGVLGIQVIESELDALGLGVKDVWEAVYKLMPAGVHDKVKPHIWEQYW
jgi:hypothetical protein